MTGRVSRWRTETQEADGLGDVTPSLGICHHSCYTDQLLCLFGIFSFINLLITVKTKEATYLYISLRKERQEEFCHFNVKLALRVFMQTCVSSLTLITLTPALHANPDLAFGLTIVRVAAL